MADLTDFIKNQEARKNRTSGGAFMRGLGQGATLNFSDEIYAGVKAGAFSGPKYEEELRKVRESFKAYEEQFPKSSMAGEITGVVGTSILPGSLAVRGGQALNTGSKILNAGKNLGIGSAVGGSEAVVAGVGDSENKADYIGSGEALKDLGFGMALGAGGYVVTSAVAKPLTLFKDYIVRKHGKKASKVVEQNLQRIVEDTGMSMTDVIGRIANGEIIAEMNATTRALTRALRTKGAGTRTQKFIEQEATKRSKAGREAGALELGQGLSPGYSDDIYGEFDKANKLNKQKTSTAYAQAPGQTNAHPEVNAIVQDILLKQPELADEVLKIARAKGTEPLFKIQKNGKFTFRKSGATVDEAETIYRTMRNETTGLFKNNKGERGDILQKEYENLKESIDNYYPNVTKARQMSFVQKKSAEAFKYGQGIWSKKPNEVRAFLRELNETFTNETELTEVISSLRAGAMDDLGVRSGKVSKKSMFTNLADEENNMNKILREIYPDDQLQNVLAQLDRTVNSQTLETAVKGNSQTADILSGVKRLDQGNLVGDGLQAVSGDPMAVLRIAKQIGSKAMEGLSEKNQFELAQLLLESKPDIVKRALTTTGGVEELANAIEVLAQKIKMTGAGTAGVMSQNQRPTMSLTVTPSDAR